MVDLSFATIDEGEIYFPEPMEKYRSLSMGELKPFKERSIEEPD
jgi:hypothetical protein